MFPAEYEQKVAKLDCQKAYRHDRQQGAAKTGPRLDQDQS
jgi:hypothetical protein